MKFECKYCGAKFPLEEKEIDGIVKHLETHKKLGALKNLTKATLKAACEHKEELAEKVKGDKK